MKKVACRNCDGFVGFAGWADDTNVQPILTAFCAWVDGVEAFTGQGSVWPLWASPACAQL